MSNYNSTSRDAIAKGALGTVQAGLGKATPPVTADDTIEIFGLRDPREEAEFAAAKVQRLLDTATVGISAEIGLLIPDDATYDRASVEAFDRLGLPLSGQPSDPALRDEAGELMALLLVLFERPAPRTAIASLYISPFMPWTSETGLRMARELMDRGWSRTAAALDGPSRDVLDALRVCSTPEQLVSRLAAVAKAAPEAGLWPNLQAIRTALTDKIDWPLLRRIAAPRQSGLSGHDRFVEGISLFREAALPWRPVRQLIVLGLAGRAWPRPPATLLVPACTLAGERKAPSTGLSLITHMTNFDKPEKAIRDIRAEPESSWPIAVDEIAPVSGGGIPSTPAVGFLHLGSDLLRLREDDETGNAPQSPSRLETLIVSPLAWLLDELDAKDRTWGPETLDVMTLGTLLHHVMEIVFPEGTKMPDQSQIADAVPDALSDAIRRHAPWLSNDAWETERQSLLREAHDVTSKGIVRLSWREKTVISVSC